MNLPLHRVTQLGGPFDIPLGLHTRNFKLDPRANASGSLGDLKKFDHPNGLQSIMIKRFPDPFKSTDSAKLILREINILRTVRHDNILYLLGTYLTEEENTKSIYHITLYCGIPLTKKIEEGKYSFEDAINWIRQLFQALQHLHMNEVIYRDLEPKNICIDANKKATLTGFGKSRVVEKSASLTQERGTAPYMPIELFMGEDKWSGTYDKKVDIWTAAVILCEVLTGHALFKTKNSLKTQVEYCGPIEDHLLANVISDLERRQLHDASKKAARKDFIKILQDKLLPGRDITKDTIKDNADPLKEFIDNTLQLDAALRFSAEEALNHRFLYKPQQPERPGNNLSDDLDQLRTLIEQELRSSPDCVALLKQSCGEQ